MDSFELLVEAHRPGMKRTLATLVELLRAHGVRYVIGGANALSLYVRPRMTAAIDAFVDPRRKDELDRLLAERFRVERLERFHSKSSTATWRWTSSMPAPTPRTSPSLMRAMRRSSARA
jgi:hypothetical protein